MTVIQIRGTSGSGKTWVMKSLLTALGPFKEVFTEGRRNPLFYLNSSSTAILGAYRSACGGCDNIGSAAAVAELIQNLQEGVYSEKPGVIICEGLLLSEDSKWTLQMNDVRIIYLVTPVETCIQQILNRRAEAGNDKPLNESNTRNRVRVIERSRTKLLEKGIICRRCTSKQAPEIILNWIKESNCAK